MARLFGSDKTPKSKTKRAKAVIRKEIKSCLGPFQKAGNKYYSFIVDDSAVQYSDFFGLPKSDYERCLNHAKLGGFAIESEDQKKMLGKIYGKENVSRWSSAKLTETYNHLVAREYASMLKEKNGGKVKWVNRKIL